MPIQPEWQDRRGMFQRGREVHEPSSASARRASESSVSAAAGAVAGAVSEALGKTATNQSTASNASSGTIGSPTSPTKAAADYNPAWGIEHRRRSSAASGSSGMFANLLNHTRGSEDYHQRRSSHAEMEARSPGIFGGVWNSTFRGMQKSSSKSGNDGENEAIKKEIRRGVME